MTIKAAAAERLRAFRLVRAYLAEEFNPGAPSLALIDAEIERLGKIGAAPGEYPETKLAEIEAGLEDLGEGHDDHEMRLTKAENLITGLDVRVASLERAARRRRGTR